MPAVSVHQVTPLRALELVPNLGGNPARGRVGGGVDELYAVQSKII